MEAESSFCCLELKYCERCGALWLRHTGGQENYCAMCFVQMEDSARPKKRKTNVRAAHRNRKRTRDLQAVAQECTPSARGIEDAAAYQNEAMV